MIIRDNNGRALGTIEHDASERERIDARTREILAGARSKAQQDTPAAPFFPRVRATLAAMSRAGRIAFYVLVTLAGLTLAGYLMPDDTATATTAAPAVVTRYDAPRGTVADLAPERVAPFSGSTVADARDGWSGASIDADGVVRVNGYKVDDVTASESPLRARYLAAFDANGLPRGNENATVREGVRFCGDLADGRTVALREASDSRSDVPSFGTGGRRMIVASASLVHFCPQFN